jgi:pimeloyl-ACP methyl ester carboxylesterase
MTHEHTVARRHPAHPLGPDRALGQGPSAGRVIVGHEAIAPDMPGNGERASEKGATLMHRCDAVVSQLRSGDVLVGHSGGGYDVTIAAGLLNHVVYLRPACRARGARIPEAMTVRDERPAE